MFITSKNQWEERHVFESLLLIQKVFFFLCHISFKNMLDKQKDINLSLLI